MAQHIALDKKDEPRLFSVIENNKERLFNVGELLKDFSKMDFQLNSKKTLKVQKLSSEYVEKPDAELALMIGNFTLQQDVGEEDQWLTVDIPFEVHLTISKRTAKVLIKNIFWVV